MWRSTRGSWDHSGLTSLPLRTATTAPFQILAAIKDRRLYHHAQVLTQGEEGEEVEEEEEDGDQVSNTTITSTTVTSPSEEAPDSQKTRKNNMNKAKLKTSLQEMCAAQEEVMRLLEENSSIIRRFQRLAALPPSQD